MVFDNALTNFPSGTMKSDPTENRKLFLRGSLLVLQALRVALIRRIGVITGRVTTVHALLFALY